MSTRNPHDDSSVAAGRGIRALEIKFARLMGWSDLSTDILHLIAARITLHADYIRFRAVCASWRSAVTSRPCHLPPQLPFLMLPARDDPSGAKTRNFYSLTEDRTYRIEFPNHKHCLGSSYGWLILLGPSTALSLLNPFTRSEVRLPPATQIPNLSDTVTATDVKNRLSEFHGERTKTSAGFWKHLVRKAKLCWERSSSKERCIVVAFPKAGLAFWQPGRKAWTHAGRYWQFVDVEFYKGKLYAITRGGILSTIEINTIAKETVIISAPPFSYNGSSVYLVESAEGLLLVVRKYQNHGGDQRCRRTERFEVFELKSSTGEHRWARIESIGDRILIVERGTSLSLPTSGLVSCKRNCIYFSDEYDVCSEDQITGLDFGVFCLEDGSVQRLQCYPQDAESLWPFPSWVTPNLW